MKPGILEIILVIVVIIVVVIIARIIRTRHTASPKKNTGTRTTVKSPGEKRDRLRNVLNRMGLAFVIGGIALLIASVTMFRYAFQSYVISFIIIVAGFVIIFVLRKRK
jgi:hypothetical protein